LLSRAKPEDGHTEDRYHDPLWSSAHTPWGAGHHTSVEKALVSLELVVRLVEVGNDVVDPVVVKANFSLCITESDLTHQALNTVDLPRASKIDGTTVSNNHADMTAKAKMIM
tara:strand:- start:306 stop:641 length:336 start_codon:yes stop_codon:yes gene_type:complete